MGWTVTEYNMKANLFVQFFQLITYIIGKMVMMIMIMMIMIMMIMMIMIMMMILLCLKAGSLAFKPSGDEMSELVSHCLPHRQLWASNLSKVATQRSGLR